AVEDDPDPVAGDQVARRAKRAMQVEVGVGPQPTREALAVTVEDQGELASARVGLHRPRELLGGAGEEAVRRRLERGRLGPGASSETGDECRQEYGKEKSAHRRTSCDHRPAVVRRAARFLRGRALPRPRRTGEGMIATLETPLLAPAIDLAGLV